MSRNSYSKEDTMPPITESQLRKAIRSQIIRSLTEGSEAPAAKTKVPLSKVLNLACDKFVRLTENSKATADLGENGGKVTFYLSGSSKKPLVKRGSVPDFSFESAEDMKQAFIDALREAYYENDMGNDEYRKVMTKAAVVVQLKTGLRGYRIDTNIPYHAGALKSLTYEM
jgi:hypothetical protein